MWSELKHIHNHMPLQQIPSFYIPLESTCCLISAYCHKFCNRELYDGFVLPDKNFKNIIFDSLITGRSCENLSYLSSCSLSQRWRFRRIRSNALRGTELGFIKSNDHRHTDQLLIDPPTYRPNRQGSI